MNTVLLNTTNGLTGRSSELHVMAELTFLGIPVFHTEHPYTRADLLIEVDGEIKRIQVKTMMQRKDRNYFVVRPEDKRKRSYGDSVDYFIFYCREEKQYFIIPYEIAKKVSEITWIPERDRKHRGGAHRIINLDEYQNRWDILCGEIDEWQRKRLDSI